MADVISIASYSGRGNDKFLERGEGVKTKAAKERDLAYF